VPWRGPEVEGELPSLGWSLLDWWADYLPSPRDHSSPLIFTDEQAKILVGWYEFDPVTMRFVYRLLREEGLLLGSTSGINVAAAFKLAKQLGPGHTIVTILCDGGAKYQSRLFNQDWIREKGFADAIAG
jgi:hypothetical protein